MNKESSKGMWKRTFNIYKSIKLPFILYILQVVLGIVSAKIGLLYIPYYSKMQTGQVSDNAIIWGFLGFSILNVFFGLVAAMPEIYANFQVIRKLQIKLIRKVLHLPVKNFEQETASQLISRITLDSEYVNNVIAAILGSITGVTTAFMSISEMAGINKSLSFLVVPIVIYVFFCAWLSGKIDFLTSKRTRKSFSQTTAFFSEHMPYLHNIKQLNAQKEEFKRGKTAIEIIYKADIYNAVMSFFSMLVTGSSNTILAIIIFVFGSRLVREGQIDLPALSAFYQYILIAYSSFSVIPDLYRSFMSSNGELFYIGEILESDEEKYERVEKMPLSDSDIIFENVNFFYNEDKPILDNISCIIPKGKRTALVGLNGSGKTTMLKLIERFYTAKSGNISFGDTLCEDIHLDEWRKSFGYVLQKPRLINSTIRENITYGIERECTDDEVIAAAKMASAYSFIEKIPDGLDFKVGDDGCRLSQGEKQRIAIARAIMIDPSYLLLDEATSNIDVKSKQEVDKALLRLMKDKTTVFISHDMDEIRSADNIIVLNNGTIEAQGSVEEVSLTSPTYKKIMNGGADNEIEIS